MAEVCSWTWLPEANLDPKHYLIQFQQDGRDSTALPGEVLRTPYGSREWHDPQKYADAVILIGGRGGTYKTWLGALHDGIPRFPFGGLGGDSEAAYDHTCDLWDVIPVPGITLDDFSRIGAAIRTREDAAQVAAHVVGKLLWQAISATDSLWRKRERNAASLFISYSRKDAEWVTRLRTVMRPAERRGLVCTWVDVDLSPGRAFEPQILEQIAHADAAVLVVSPHLMASQYVRNIEFPAFMKRRSDPRFRLFWFLLDDCEWRSLPELKSIQATGPTPGVPLTRSATNADAQCRLIEISRQICRELEGQSAPPVAT